MNTMEFIKELLLGLSIAVVLPTVTYWGIYAFYSSAFDKEVAVLQEKQISSSDSEKQEEINREYFAKTKEIYDRKKQVNFFTYICIGILAIIAGLLISVQSLSVGFISGGIINILIGITNSLNSAVLTFVSLLGLLVFLIAVVLVKRFKTN